MTKKRAGPKPARLLRLVGREINPDSDVVAKLMELAQAAARGEVHGLVCATIDENGVAKTHIVLGKDCFVHDLIAAAGMLNHRTLAMADACSPPAKHKDGD